MATSAASAWRWFSEISLKPEKKRTRLKTKITYKSDNHMLDVKLEFNAKWLKAMRKKNVRVLIELEEWLKSQKHYKMNSCSTKVMHVEVAEQYLEDFKKSFKEKLTNDYNVPEPEKVCTLIVCAEDNTDGMPFLDMVESIKSLMGRKDDIMEFPASDEEAERPDPGDTLKEILLEAPCKYSKELSDFLKETAAVVPMLQKMDSLKSFWNQTLLVSMDDGYGMTGFLGSLCKLYHSLGIASKLYGQKPRAHEMAINVNTLEPNIYSDWDSAVEKAKEMSCKNESTVGAEPVLCLDISAWQNKLTTDDIRKYLRKLNVHGSNFTLVFRIPFVDAHALNDVASALGDVFSVRSLTVPPMSLKDLTEYAKNQLEARNFTLKKDAEQCVEKMILQEKRDASFFGFRTVDKLVEKIIYEKAKSNCAGNKPDRGIAYKDIVSCVVEDDFIQVDPEIKLQELVGLQSVKDKVYQIVAQIKAFKNLSREKKRRMARPSIHMMFTGSPGTGKTTVARIVADLFHKEGILSKGMLVEVKARDLCGEWIGSTSPKTSALCRDAYGSVLFIDEAYSLFKGDRTDKRDYGLEAITALIAEMENHRDDMCVILAGYTDDMTTMLQANAGLKDRIPFTVEFPNYSREDLVKIFFMMVDNGGFKYEQALKRAVKEFFDKIPDLVFASKEFSNARFVRNLYERTWGKAACRCSLGAGDITLLASDLLGAAEENEFKLLQETKPVRKIRIGF